VTEEPSRELRARLLAERQRIRQAPREQRAQLAHELRETEREIRREARDAKRSGRAPAMSVEDRRAAILHVALPMLVEREGNVTTGEIAAAAGIAEGTLFRAFGDKRELLIACFRSALESEHEIARVRDIDRGLPLVERLLLAMRAVADYQQVVWGTVMALHKADIDPRAAAPDKDKADAGQPPRAMIEISQAIADLMNGEPLRTNPQLAARMLLGLVLSTRMSTEGFGTQPAEMRQIVDVFLHGIVRSEGGRND
jgi:AcrR family transcriptional regulator